MKKQVMKKKVKQKKAVKNVIKKVAPKKWQASPTTTRQYETNDTILPTLDLFNPTNIEIVISPNRVTLQIGPRDFEWDRRSGKLRGAGTALAPMLSDETSEEIVADNDYRADQTKKDAIDTGVHDSTDVA